MYLILYPDLESIFELTMPRSNQRYDAVIAFLDWIANNGEVYRPTEEQALANIRNANRQETIIQTENRVPFHKNFKEANDKIVQWLINDILDPDGKMMCKKERGGYVYSGSPRLIQLMLFLEGYVWVQTMHIRDAQNRIKNLKN